MADQATDVGVYKNVKVIPVTTFLTQYTDGHGKEETKLGFIMGPDVRFLDLKAMSKPAQSWLRDEILVALGKKDAPQEAVKVESPSLEQQV